MNDDRDALAALDARGDQLVRFADCERQARDYIEEVGGTGPLVEELRAGLAEKRSIRLGTINTIVLMKHIEALEADIRRLEAGSPLEPIVKP